MVHGIHRNGRGSRFGITINTGADGRKRQGFIAIVRSEAQAVTVSILKDPCLVVLAPLPHRSHGVNNGFGGQIPWVFPMLL